MSTQDVFTARRITRAPQYAFVHFQNYPLVVGLAVIPLATAPIPASEVIIQAANANGGIVEIGGVGFSALGAGLELTAGQAISFSVAGVGDLEQMGALGIGVSPYLTSQGRGFVGSFLDRLARRGQKRYAINLQTIRVVANLAGQNLRVVFTLPPEVD